MLKSVQHNAVFMCIKIYVCTDIDLGEVLFHYELFCDKDSTDLSSKICRVSMGGISWDLLNIFVPSLVPVGKKNFIRPNLR